MSAQFIAIRFLFGTISLENLVGRTSVMESPMVGTLIFRFSNNGVVAETMVRAGCADTATTAARGCSCRDMEVLHDDERTD